MNELKLREEVRALIRHKIANLAISLISLITSHQSLRTAVLFVILTPASFQQEKQLSLLCLLEAVKGRKDFSLVGQFSAFPDFVTLAPVIDAQDKLEEPTCSE